MERPCIFDLPISYKATFLNMSLHLEDLQFFDLLNSESFCFNTLSNFVWKLFELGLDREHKNQQGWEQLLDLEAPFLSRLYHLDGLWLCKFYNTSSSCLEGLVNHLEATNFTSYKSLSLEVGSWETSYQCLLVSPKNWPKQLLPFLWSYWRRRWSPDSEL